MALSMLWPNGIYKAFTLSFDDGVLQDERLIGIMRKYGIKGTFNIDTGFMGWNDYIVRDEKNIDHSHTTVENFKNMYSGQEVAVHGLTHLNLAEVCDASLLYEVIEDRANLERILQIPIHGMAYPFGGTNDRVKNLLAHCGIRYARSVKTTKDFSLPKDPLEWECTCKYTDLDKYVEAFLNAEANSAILLSAWGHSYEFDQFDDWEHIDDLLRQLGGKKDVWYATNIEIFDYLKSFELLDMDLSGRFIKNESFQTVWVRFEGKVYSINPGEIIQLESNYNEKHVHPFSVLPMLN